jgi:hypothetical protein
MVGDQLFVFEMFGSGKCGMVRKDSSRSTSLYIS